MYIMATNIQIPVLPRLNSSDSKATQGEQSMINKKILAVTVTVMLMCAGGLFCFGYTISDTHAQQTKASEVLQTEAVALPQETIPEAEQFDIGNGNVYLAQYQYDESVHQLVLVRQSESDISGATLYLLEKNKYNQWHMIMECPAYIGENGLDKTIEGDKKTPRGDFSLSHAMGIKPDPGSIMTYTVITDSMYVCGDPEYYNQIIDTAYVAHECGSNSEHLIDYIPQYNYTLYVDYNPQNEYGKGSAIMLHCFGSYPYTMGCIAIAEENMIKVLQTVSNGSRICIY